jgi:ATP-dependent Lon protease
MRTLNLAHVNYVATANSIDPLPSPLRDRLRILPFPTPTSDYLPALLPPLMEAYAVEHGQDGRWLTLFSAEDIEILAAHWKGGSVRRLQRLVEAALRARERSAVRH